MIYPGENDYAAAQPRNVCRHCGVEIFKGVTGTWWHLGRHGYQNHIECRSTTIAEPMEDR